jgi:hypothetical protein
MGTLARSFAPLALISVLEATSKAAAEIRNQDNPRLVVEMALLGLFLGGETPQVAPQVVGDVERPMPRQQRVDSSPLPPAPQPLPETAPKEVAVPPAAARSEAVVEHSSAPTADQLDDELLELVKAAWPDLLDALAKSKRVMARAYLMPATPSRVEGGKKLVLVYPQKYGTHMEQIQVPDNRSVVEQYLSRLVKRKFDIQVVASEGEAGVDGAGGSGAGYGAGTNAGGTEYHDGGSNGFGALGSGDGPIGGAGNAGSPDINGAASSPRDLHPLVRAAITILDGKVVS